ncbi:NTR domain-containing protein [Caenorhabditis elegans]|uniref:NTR domain-containing protein n=1 Tax=Caenorhabditis elegans TaxID=6239 RepID=Q21267_CAEEL|nr:NTR domain-containing protein [Caenorhabditis elegans]CCD64758.1 NTR domain-containing protein [Caenorhabditis elegans]|eukprot:NP_505115.1 Tissue Inhibitor of MetalloProtease [Caenorhabditis elegans]
MLAVVFTFLLCLSFPQSFESCSCMEFQSEKDGYCATSWISKVKVVSKETDGLGLMMSYRLEHLKVIKAPENMTLPETMNTATQESACGQTKFKVGKQYIFGGSLANNDSLLITFCDWRVPLKYIDEPKLEMKPTWKKFVDSVGKCPPPPSPLSS